MNTVLLFRKRTPLTDDRLPWLRGSEEHTWTARRNASGKGVVSAILVQVLLYVWLISIGTRTIRDGLRDLVDRKDRRDLSIFQIGLRSIERCVINAFSYRILLCSYR